MGLYENMLTEPISRLALRQAITVEPELSVRDAVLRMREKKLGCVIVIDGQQKPLGMFTEAMLRIKLIESRGILDDSVQNHMARQFPLAQADDPIVTVLELMQAENHRFVCVVDQAGKIVGLTGQKGLMEYIADHFPQLVMTQRAGAKPPLTDREGA
ncbi:MAG: CBS domain-containing protein [Pirellulaceae bacterium]